MKDPKLEKTAIHNKYLFESSAPKAVGKNGRRELAD